MKLLKDKIVLLNDDELINFLLNIPDEKVKLIHDHIQGALGEYNP